MSDVMLSAVMAALILGCLGAVATGMILMMRRAQRQLSGDQKKPVSAAARSITSDEIIDLHLALKDVKDLREISERIPA